MRVAARLIGLLLVRRLARTGGPLITPYINDALERLRLLMHPGPNEPANFGNEEELTVLEIAERIRELTGSRLGLVCLLAPRPEDTPSPAPKWAWVGRLSAASRCGAGTD